ncbi:DUF2637 domain-containing protein [Kitasatospora sp. NPDC051914]|uniref:DUF2637 domain-containing protein n=1 Tax=Kitasatospora sp. NPDC051914 TaxID=3154945 RepID=UPI0034175E3B
MTAATAHTPGPDDTSAFTRNTITAVMALIAALAFVFSFGNIWALALRLDVPHPIAPLIGPMVDLSVIGLLVALHHLTLKGTAPVHLAPARRLMHLCGALTIALNIAEPIAAGHWGRAALDAVAPTLLLGWGTVGPSLLAHLHTPTTNPNRHTAPDAPSTLTPPPAPQPAAPDIKPGLAPTPTPAPATADQPPVTEPAPAAPPAPPDVPAPLLIAARRIADAHHASTGDVITSAQLRAHLGVPTSLADAAHAHLAAVPV